MSADLFEYDPETQEAPAGSSCAVSADGGRRERIPMVEAQRWCRRVLRASGFNGRDAGYLAHNAVLAEARGRQSHGLLQVPKMVEAVRNGQIDPMAQPSFRRDGHLLCIDARGVAGPLALRDAVGAATRGADQHRVSCVAASGCGWLGALDVAVLPAVTAGYLVQLTTCVNHHVMACFGGASGVVGTNAICWGIPSHPPGVLDSSLSVVPYNSLDRPGAHDEPVGFDRLGTETAVYREVLNGGTMCSRGGNDGHVLQMLAIMAEMLCIGSAGRLPQFPDLRQGFYVHVLAVDASARSWIDRSILAVRAAWPAAERAIRLPGDQARANLEESGRLGLRIDKRVRQALNATAETLGLPTM